ncbi:MAG: UDP-N-acetylglucosamine 1-carboxyvinyltransferase, partial [Clostridiales bacterium]|nr:UDP-N-acetylglucosamine 1-carboxyvinyltransferase [Clostridiales bacterium]
MEKLVITGGTPLRGNISVSGSKNAAAALLPAALLSDTPCILENVPYILDNSIMLEIINNLGASGEWIGKNTVRIDSKGLNTYKASYELTSKLRGSYYFLGALLGKVGRAEVSQPGGCNFESRPIDQHIKGLKALGAEIIEEYGLVKAYTENGVTSAHIFMDVVSVGATINLMIAAVKGSGITILENCAKEPHVVDVANFFNTMGANVKGAGTDTIKIKGVAHLESTRPYSVIPDQIEAGTFMIAAAVSRGDVTVRNIIPKHQEALLAKLSEMNVGIEEGEDSIRVYYKGKIRDTKIKTLPY